MPIRLETGVISIDRGKFFVRGAVGLDPIYDAIRQHPELKDEADEAVELITGTTGVIKKLLTIGGVVGKNEIILADELPISVGNRLSRDAGEEDLLTEYSRSFAQATEVPLEGVNVSVRGPVRSLIVMVREGYGERLDYHLSTKGVGAGLSIIYTPRSEGKYKSAQDMNLLHKKALPGFITDRLGRYTVLMTPEMILNQTIVDFCNARNSQSE